MKLLQLILLLVVAATTIGAERVSYEGFSVYRVTPLTQDHLDYLISLEDDHIFWESCSKLGKFCDVMLSPTLHGTELDVLSVIGVEIEVFVEDVLSLIPEEIAATGNGRLTWDKYYRLDDINTYLTEQADNHSHAEVFSIGKSHENRDLNVIKIAKNSTRKPAIFVEANAHAREWITSGVATYLIDALLNSGDADVQKWTDDFDWYVLPVFNPDGLEYTHTTNRMWRKNRKDDEQICDGVDLNRNFDYNWGGEGSSHNPCAETFCGSGPNSEPETKAVVHFVETISEDLVFYLSIHSCSQFIMFPYGDKIDTTFYDSNMEIATKAAEAAAVRYGTIFQPGNWMEILYTSTGDSMDWAKDKLNVSLSLTYELRDTGRYGFLLPPEQIVPSSEELIDSLKPILDALRNGSV